VDGYITTTDLMKKLKVSRTTIDRWRKEGMPFKKFQRSVRFVEKDVLKWLEKSQK
jgi:excisionase family DNA binding protein